MKTLSLFFCHIAKSLYFCICFPNPEVRNNHPINGEMAERSIAAVLKTVDLRGSGGSNPSLSANFITRLRRKSINPHNIDL